MQFHITSCLDVIQVVAHARPQEQMLQVRHVWQLRSATSTRRQKLVSLTGKTWVVTQLDPPIVNGVQVVAHARLQEQGLQVRHVWQLRSASKGCNALLVSLRDGLERRHHIHHILNDLVQVCVGPSAVSAVNLRTLVVVSSPNTELGLDILHNSWWSFEDGYRDEQRTLQTTGAPISITSTIAADAA